MPALRKTSEELGIKGVNINDFSAGITSVFIGGTAAGHRSTAPGRRIFGQPPVGSFGTDVGGLHGSDEE